MSTLLGLLGEALSEASPGSDALAAAGDHQRAAVAPTPTRWSAPSAASSTPGAGRTQRNGYRHRDLDTRVGTIDVAIPKLRKGTYFPEWLLERRKRAESALITVVATATCSGSRTRRMDKLVKTLGIDSLSQVAGLADGRRPGRARGGSSAPARSATRAVHVRGRRRVDDEGPRGRPRGQRRRAGRDRRQRRRAPRGPRACGSPPARPGRRGTSSSPTWSPAAWPAVRAGHLRRPRRAGRGDRGEPARRSLAAVPHPLRREPDAVTPEVDVAGGQGDAALGLRPARRRANIQRWTVCSDKCRGKVTWSKVKRLKITARQQQKIKIVENC